MTEPPLQRARGVLVSPDGAVLLMRVRNARGQDLWITPGGGIEPGETPRAALVRELREETGLVGARIGPELWTRDGDCELGGRRHPEHERFFLVEVERFAPTTSGMPDASERSVFQEFRWWSPGEIEHESACFAPRRLGALLHALRTAGPPPAPIDAGC